MHACVCNITSIIDIIYATIQLHFIPLSENIQGGNFRDGLASFLPYLFLQFRYLLFKTSGIFKRVWYWRERDVIVAYIHSNTVPSLLSSRIMGGSRSAPIGSHHCVLLLWSTDSLSIRICVTHYTQVYYSIIFLYFNGCVKEVLAILFLLLTKYE